MTPNPSIERTSTSGLRPLVDATHVKRWPTLKQVVAIWAVPTALVFGAFIFYLRSLPPDELVVANTLCFQAMVGVLFVVLPATFLLLLFLMFGAIAKRWLLRSKPGREEHGNAL